jgi:spermidine/putrescine transport system permease protein
MALSPSVQRGEVTSRSTRLIRAWASAGPGLLWIFLFFVVPVLAIVVVSFLSRGEYGTVERPWTLENYARLAGFGLLGFDLVYPTIVLRSVLLGFFTAALCMVVGLPLAFFIARLPRRHRSFALTLVVIPFWTNLLIRTYAWQILLGPQSWITHGAVWLGLVSEGEALYPGTLAVYLCMVCDYLPFMVLPLYAAAEKLDWSLPEAVMDLGGGRLQVFRHGILPQMAHGLAAGFILVFLPATGQFVIPDLLGGAKTVMLGNAIQQQFGPNLDWPFGSAAAVVAMILVIAGIWIFSRQNRKADLEIL